MDANAEIVRILEEILTDARAGKIHAVVVIAHGEDERVSIMHCEEIGHRIKLAEGCMNAGDQVLGDLTLLPDEDVHPPRKVTLNG